MRKNAIQRAQASVDRALSTFKNAHDALEASEVALKGEVSNIDAQVADLLGLKSDALAQLDQTGKVKNKLAEFLV